MSGCGRKDKEQNMQFKNIRILVGVWLWETGFVANNNCKLSLALDCSFTFGFHDRFLSITARNMQSFGSH